MNIVQCMNMDYHTIYKTKDPEVVFYQNSQVFMVVNDAEIQCFGEAILGNK